MFFQPQDSQLCAPYALAYMSGETVERTIGLLGSKGATIGELRLASLECGLMADSQEVEFEGEPPCDCFIVLKVRGRKDSHCSAYKGKETYDPDGFVGSYKDAMEYWKSKGRRVLFEIRVLGALIGRVDLD